LREARLAANADRQRNNRANEDEIQRAERLEADAIHHQLNRENENPEERAERLATVAERNRINIANENAEQRAERLAADVARHQNIRANEDIEDRAQRLVVDVARHQAQRNNLTAEQRAEMNQRRRERAQMEGRTRPNRRAAYNWRNMDDRDPLVCQHIRGFYQTCDYCLARYSPEELNTNRQYNKCCMKGILKLKNKIKK
jgi:hypothetical protein